MFYIDIHTHFDWNEPNHIYIKNLIAGKDNCQTKTYYTCGIHPWYIENFPEKFEILEKHISDNKMLGIGECGMDYRKEYLLNSNKKIQKEVFVKQAFLAKKIKKPLVIHCVKCIEDLLEIRKDYPTQKWIFHGFNKKKEVAKKLIKTGIYLSYGAGIIKNSTTAESLSITPLDHLFLETDDQKEYSIREIYKKAAFILQIPLDELEKQIASNAEKVFHIKIQPKKSY